MMESIGKYIISIVCAAAVCASITSLVSKNKATSGIIRMISGIFLTIVVIAPVLKIKFDDIELYISAVNAEADAVASEGADAANTQAASIIKEELESYILEKAAAMDLTITVQITMTDDFPPLPYSAKLSGSVSPYNKQILSDYISDELGIPEERQIWN